MQRRFLALCLFLVAGCSGPPKTISWEEAMKPEALDGQRVILEGYPGVSVTVVSHEGTQQCCLFDTAAGVSSSAQRVVTLVLTAGTGPNQAEPLPEEYQPGDLKVHCEDGSVATYQDKIRVHGSAENNYGGLYIQDIERIEKVK